MNVGEIRNWNGYPAKLLAVHANGYVTVQAAGLVPEVQAASYWVSLDLGSLSDFNKRRDAMMYGEKPCPPPTQEGKA